MEKIKSKTTHKALILLSTVRTKLIFCTKIFLNFFFLTKNIHVRLLNEKFISIFDMMFKFLFFREKDRCKIEFYLLFWNIYVIFLKLIITNWWIDEWLIDRTWIRRNCQLLNPILRWYHCPKSQRKSTEMFCLRRPESSHPMRELDTTVYY